MRIPVYRSFHCSLYIASLFAGREKIQQLQMQCLVKSRLPTDNGTFDIYYYEDAVLDKEIIVLANGHFQSKSLKSLGHNDRTIDHSAHHANGIRTLEKIFVRIHSSCITSEVFTSNRCDCAQQLQESLKIIGREGGLVIYLDQEGRNIGLLNKLKAYNLIDQGWDTVTANIELGFKEDERTYKDAALILKDLGVDDIYLMTNNPQKVLQMEEYGIHVLERIPLLCSGLKDLGSMHGRNKASEMQEYFMTKVWKMGHIL